MSYVQIKKYNFKYAEVIHNDNVIHYVTGPFAKTRAKFWASTNNYVHDWTV